MEREDGEEKRREEEEKKERGEKEREVTGRTDVAGVGLWLVEGATVAGVRLVRRHRPRLLLSTPHRSDQGSRIAVD